MIYWVLGIIAYLIIAALTYQFYMKKSESHETWEKIMLSLSWFALPPLWIIHKIHNMM
jgi:hypothetical protein